jgi:hypothetical protein
MGDVIDIEEWYTKKVNELAQIYRLYVNTTRESDVKCTLRIWGERLAAYKMFSMRKQRGEE